MTDEAKPAEPSKDIVIPGPSGNIVLQGQGLYHDTTSLTQAYRAAVAGRCNLLAPVTRVDFIPMLHAISLRIVQLDPRPATRENKGSAAKAGGDLYELDGDVALTKVALDKIAAAAGITWVPQFYGRIDDASEPAYCRFRACGMMRDVDGRVRTELRHRETDLRKGGADRKRIQSDRQLDMALQFIEPITESKACNRVVRAFLGIKSKYTLAEATRPFIVPTLVFDGSHPDPDIRREVAIRIADEAMRAQRTVYGGAQLGSPATGTGPTAMLEGPLAPPPPLPVANADDQKTDEELDAELCQVCRAGAGQPHLDGCPNEEKTP